MFFKSGKIMRQNLFFVCLSLFSTTLLVSLVMFNSEAYAQRNGADPCARAKSTSEVHDCVNKKKDEAQTRMGETYRALMETQEGDARQELAESQKNWIMYRDAHCKWEATLSGTASLDRAYELSCVTDLTDLRNSVLQAATEEQIAASPREFANQPRWMNVLTESYPDIFWRFGSFVSADLNCDGQDEQIMTGLSIAHIQEALIVDRSSVSKREKANEVSLVVEISDNPNAGIPTPSVHKIVVDELNQTEVKGAAHLCRPSVSIAVEEIASTNVEEETPRCQKTLVIDDKICTPVAIHWDGLSYTVVNKDTDGESQ